MNIIKQIASSSSLVANKIQYFFFRPVVIVNTQIVHVVSLYIYTIICNIYNVLRKAVSTTALITVSRIEKQSNSMSIISLQVKFTTCGWLFSKHAYALKLWTWHNHPDLQSRVSCCDVCTCSMLYSF